MRQDVFVTGGGCLGLGNDDKVVSGESQGLAAVAQLAQSEGQRSTVLSCNFRGQRH